MIADQAALARQTARSLVLDAAGAQVAVGLERVGVPSMVLKGPALVRRLYADGAFRPYVDIDLLIPAAGLAVATEVLRGLGFVYALEQARPDERSAVEQEWWRHSDGAYIDLHIAFHGIDPAEEAWTVLSAGSARQVMGGENVLFPADGALALLVALHASSASADASKPFEDLDRAVGAFPTEVWRDALKRATATSSVDSMSAGLRRTAAGVPIAEVLDLEPSSDIELLVFSDPRAQPATWRTIGAISLARLSKVDGFGARLRFVLQGLFPSPAKLRESSGRRLPLVLAYPRHWWRALKALGSGLPLLMKARRRG